MQQRDGIGERALEEWWHWVMGAKEPFLIWTSLQNLIHIQTSKKLNPRQACCALLFESSNLHLAYHPGAKNAKLDTLSKQFS